MSSYKQQQFPEYTVLDEQRFKLWLQRLENSFKNYLQVSNAASSSESMVVVRKEELLEAIERAIVKDIQSYPNWVTLQKNINPWKIASSPNEMKVFLRHICLPHVLDTYCTVIEDMFPTTTGTEVHRDTDQGRDNNRLSTDNVSIDAAVAALPMHSGPLLTSNAAQSVLPEFFRIMANGKDGIVNLCKLADLHHRIVRADEHDTHQIAQWIENEKHRREDSLLKIQLRSEKLLVLRDEDEGKVVQTSLSYLRSGIEGLYEDFTRAEKEEEEARKVFEAAVQRRKLAGLHLTSLEDFIDNVTEQQQLLRRINELRIEVDRYNASSAENRVLTFQGVQKYVQDVHTDFVQKRLSIEIPQLFDNLVSTFTHSTSLLVKKIPPHPASSSAASSTAPTPTSSTAPPSSMLSLQCAARVGLETIRIWRQLELNRCHPNIELSISNFEQQLREALEHQPLPSSVVDTEGDAIDIYKASNATVVLYFDHLHHDTPEDHVETQSRVSTCMRALRDRLYDEKNRMEMDVDQVVGDRRQLVILNCNDVVSPPLWCLPLAHSPRYLSQLWRLSDEAQRGDLYVPLEFDTEWISEDPYHTSSDEEEVWASRVKMSRSAASSSSSATPTAVLMRTIDMDPSWSEAFQDSACREVFTKTLTPAGADFLVNKVISKIEQKANQKIKTRNQKSTQSKSKAEKDNDSTTNKSFNTTAPSSSYLKAINSSSASRASIAQALIDREVKTPFGIGKIVTQLRPDHLVVVRLKWGAVGYFRKEDCIILNCGGGQSDDKLFYSVAQATYVLGSGGDRFNLHNMSLHDVAARVIQLVKTQRLVSEKLSCSHANLSLYMHGRSSVGLTTTVEAALTRWIDAAEKDKFISLLVQAENSEAEGVCLEDGFFMKEINKIIKERKGAALLSSSSSSSSSSSAAVQSEVTQLEVVVNTDEEKAVVASQPTSMKQIEVKLSEKATAVSVDTSPSPSTGITKNHPIDDGIISSIRSPLLQQLKSKSPTEDRSSCSTAARTMAMTGRGRVLKAFSIDHDEAAPPSSPMTTTMMMMAQSPSPQLSTKSSQVADPKLSAKYSPEGQVLRELVQAVMQKLKMAQSSLPNDLYRRYRYETSQSIVSSWFAFRDSRDSFDQLTRCILLWIEDHRSQLSDGDQKRLVWVNDLMESKTSTASTRRQMKVDDEEVDGDDEVEKGYCSEVELHSDADSTIRFDRDADWQDCKMNSPSLDGVLQDVVATAAAADDDDDDDDDVSDDKKHPTTQAVGHPRNDSLIATQAAATPVFHSVLESTLEQATTSIVPNSTSAVESSFDPLVYSDHLDMDMDDDGCPEASVSAAPSLALPDNSMVIDVVATATGNGEPFEADAADGDGGDDPSKINSRNINIVGDEQSSNTAVGDEQSSSSTALSDEQLSSSTAAGDEQLSSSSSSIISIAFNLMVDVFEEGLLDAINDVLVSLFDEIKVIIEGKAMATDADADAEEATGDGSGVMVIAEEMVLIDADEVTAHHRNGIVVDAADVTMDCHERLEKEEAKVDYAHPHRLTGIGEDDDTNYYFHADDYHNVNNAIDGIVAVHNQDMVVDADEGAMMLTDRDRMMLEDYPLALHGFLNSTDDDDTIPAVAVVDADGAVVYSNVVADNTSYLVSGGVAAVSYSESSAEQAVADADQIVENDSPSAANHHDSAIIKQEQQLEIKQERVGSAAVSADVAVSVPLSKSETGTAQQGQKSTSTSDSMKPAFPYDKVTVDLILTINDLHTALRFEMNRRQVLIQQVYDESKLQVVGIAFKELKDFFILESIMNNMTGRLFAAYMIKWMKLSTRQPTFGSPPRSTSTMKPAVTMESLVKVQEAEQQPLQQQQQQDEPQKKSVDVIIPRTKAPNPSKSSKAQDKYVGSKIPNPNGGMNCGLCGKHSSVFNGEKSFHMHLAWCYRRRAPNYTGGGGSSGSGGGQVEKKKDTNIDRGDGGDDIRKRKPSTSDDHPTKKHRSNSIDSTTAKSIASDRPSADVCPPPSSSSSSSSCSSDELILLTAGSFKVGMHYETCDVCREHGDVILCDSCPCIYHMRCTDITSPSPPSGKWYCIKCRQCDVPNAHYIHYSKKFSNDLVNSWILTYCEATRRWRKSFVVAMHPEKSAVMLVRWWNGDCDGTGEGGDSNWLDVSKAKILVPSSSDKSNLSNGQTTKAVTPSSSSSSTVKDNNKNTVRFTSSTGRDYNSRFKDTGPTSAMQIDGTEGGVSVPPLIRASSAGVGGIAALRDGEYPDEKSNGHINISGNGMSDTYISANSVRAALCASGSACKAVDIAVCNEGTNAFACTRPPGHHAGRYGCTSGCLSTGFCLLNNAAIAAIYARVRWGLEKVAIVDIDVHFGNGTAELLRNDPNSFFASVHMIYGEDNDGMKKKDDEDDTSASSPPPRKTRPSQSLGFYPARLGSTEVTANYVSVGVYPLPAATSSRKGGGGGGVSKKRRKPTDYDSDGAAAATTTTIADDDDDDENEGGVGVGHSNSGAVEVNVSQSIDMTEEDSTDVSTAAAPMNTQDPTDSSPTSNKGVIRDDMNQTDRLTSSDATDTIRMINKPFVGSAGFLEALESIIIPQMERFRPQLLIISAGFDGYTSDPLGGQLCLSLQDYQRATKLLLDCMARVKRTETNPGLVTGKVISLLEGGYDTSSTLGLAKCVDAHVQALRDG